MIDLLECVRSIQNLIVALLNSKGRHPTLLGSRCTHCQEHLLKSGRSHRRNIPNWAPYSIPNFLPFLSLVTLASHDSFQSGLPFYVWVASQWRHGWSFDSKLQPTLTIEKGYLSLILAIGLSEFHCLINQKFYRAESTHQLDFSICRYH